MVGGLSGALHLSASLSPAREALTKSHFKVVAFVGKLGWDHALLFVIKAEKSVARTSLSHAPARIVTRADTGA